MNIQKVFKGLTIALSLCAFCISILSPAAYASEASWGTGHINVGPINVRTGPGTSYDIAYSVNVGDVVELTGETASSGGYTWYRLVGGDGYWICQTGGWTLNVTPASDTLTCFDSYGAEVFAHVCDGDGVENWGYTVEVDAMSYTVTCSCGWGYTKACKPFYSYYGDGSVEYRYYFLGLDTDNDERVDLYPGQKKFLPNRAGSELRPYTLLEFYDHESEPPTVTLVFGDAKRNEIARYTFDWTVTVYVESYGLRMVGNDGLQVIHYVDHEFICKCLTLDTHLGDVGMTYKTGTIKDQYGIPLQKHMEYALVIMNPAEDNMNPIDWVVYIVRSISDSIYELFTNFFGLKFIFTDENSPFKFLMGS